MCGVVGYVGKRGCPQLIFDGLKRLEYRGYDSSGIAVLFDKKIHLVKSEGKLSKLEPLLPNLPANATIGMGHTRWATHGPPITVNAHPHMTDDIAIIHNGIIENYAEIKESLIKTGVSFKSQTDTEVALQLIAQKVKEHKNVRTALQEVVKLVHGAYAIGVLWKEEPDALYIIKQGAPVVLGIGQGENFFASDALALLAHTKQTIFLNDGEIAKITPAEAKIWDFLGNPISRAPVTLEWSSNSADKQGYRHYMLKEIYEQPSVVANTLSRLVNLSEKTLNMEELGLNGIDTSKVSSIIYVACGTAYYSAMISKYCVEQLSQIPVHVELASEFRYRKPYLNKNTLVIAVTQSGETADTLACIKHAVQNGCQTFAVCNVRYSSIPRSTTATLYMEAGPEVGVASTKAFTSMVLCHYLFALGLASKRKTISDSDLKSAIDSLNVLPIAVDRAVNQAQAVENIANKYYESSNFLFIGRGPSFVAALEGALKLKEISYIHAEGYAGGELKHGPIALVDKHMPIVAICAKDSHYEKMLSNVEEVKAREGLIIGVGDPNDQKVKALSKDMIPCPQISNESLQLILSVIPLQFLAYYVAVKRGTDVDQPRNLAKSVTVE